MAEVWKAKIHGAQNFQRLVVVKRILPHLSSDPEFVRMFTVEAVLSARLNHPNIVQVFEFAEVEGERYLAMEYVHGINVGDLIKQLKDIRTPLGMAAHIVREVSQALSYAHALLDEEGRPLSLIHRDVSPSNVMIGYDGGVKLLDFGVAKALTNSSDERTRTGALKGKVAYMSPEAVEGEGELDGRTDIFAAGVLLFELLTGRRLFKGHDDLRTIALVRACKVDPPSRERPEIPPELDRIVLKALARDRDLRYQRADDLVSDLTRVAHDYEWDTQQTASFLRLHEIQPGSEPELKALTPGARSPAPEPESPETMQVTVMERRMRSSSSLAAVGPHRSRLRWALAGAAGALAVTGGLLFGLRLGEGPGAAAAPPDEVELPAASTSVMAAPAQPAAAPAQPAAAPAPAPVAADPETGVAGSLAAAPTAVVEPTPGEAALSAALRPKKVATASAAAKARKSRRKPPKQAPPPVGTAAASAAAGERQVEGQPPRGVRPSAPSQPPPPDLKRGEILKTF
jgi:serine/threonine protein kinase